MKYYRITLSVHRPITNPLQGHLFCLVTITFCQTSDIFYPSLCLISPSASTIVYPSENELKHTHVYFYLYLYMVIPL